MSSPLARTPDQDATFLVAMIAAVASENGAPHDYASDTPSSVSWQRFSADDGRGTYELVTRTLATSAASEVSLIRNGHRVKVVLIFCTANDIEV